RDRARRARGPRRPGDPLAAAAARPARQLHRRAGEPPAAGLRADQRQLPPPPERPPRQAYELISDTFGPGFNGPLVVLAEGLDPAAAEQSAGAIAVAIGGTPAGTPGEVSGGLD